MACVWLPCAVRSVPWRLVSCVGGGVDGIVGSVSILSWLSEVIYFDNANVTICSRDAHVGMGKAKVGSGFTGGSNKENRKFIVVMLISSFT